ncbi:MAG: Gldg family protein [Kiritimatiellia bacterium]
MNKTPIWKILGGTATLAIATCAAIFLNIIAHRFGGLRADLTEDGLFSLSDGTRTVLKDLPRDVTLKYYVSLSSVDMPAIQKQYAERAADLLREYASAGGGKIHLEINNVKPDSDEEDWARKYGLSGQIANPMKRDEFFCGLVILSGSEEKTMPFLAVRGEQQLEYDLTKAIHEVSQPNKPKVGVISSLPVFGTPGGNPMMMMQQQQGAPKWMALQALESFFQLADLGAGVTEIPADVKTVLAIHPKGLSPQTLYALDQFVLRGGRLIAFVDPLCMADRESAQGNPMMGMGMDTSSSLNALTKTWGVELIDGKVVGDAKLATQLQIRRGRVDNVPVVMTLGHDQASKDDVATAQLEMVMLPMAGRLNLSKVEGLTATELLSTTDHGGVVNAMEAMGDMEALARSLLPEGRIVTAAKVTGIFPSAFPGGAPKSAETNATAQATNAVPHLVKGEKEAAVVVIADADLLADMWTVSVQNLGRASVEPVTDNLALVINLTEQLNGSDALIGLRSRGSFARPFTKIRDIQQKAQVKYQEEYDKTVAKIEEVNRKLGELSRGRKGEDKVSLNNSIAAEIKKFQGEVREMNGRRRELEKQLRREVEGLEFNVKALNLAAVPLLVIAFGLTRGILRRRRSNTPA